MHLGLRLSVIVHWLGEWGTTRRRRNSTMCMDYTLIRRTTAAITRTMWTRLLKGRLLLSAGGEVCVPVVVVVCLHVLVGVVFFAVVVVVLKLLLLC